MKRKIKNKWMAGADRYNGLYHSPLLARIIVTCLTVILVLAIGFISTWYQVQLSIQHDNEISAQKLISKTDDLLSEAEDVASKARIYLKASCNNETTRNLNQLAITSPHLRVVSLIHGTQLTCSSYDGSKLRNIDLREYSGERLSIKSDSASLNDNSILVLLTKFPEGIVGTSIETSHLKDDLILFSASQPLILQVGKRFLSSDGIYNPLHDSDLKKIKSKRYPYQIGYVNNIDLTVISFVKKGKVLLVAFLLIGLMGGSLVWWFSFKEPNLYDLLAKGIKNGEIIPWYQPIIKTDTGEIHGVEVLARWFPQSGDMVTPDLFIPLAERSGLIVPLTQKIMEQTAKDLLVITGRLHSTFHVGINISAAHLKEKEKTIEDFRVFKNKFTKDSIQITVEITEREQFLESGQLDIFLKEFHQMGIKIALDDFGTGYSNLNYLNSLPIDFIKIDHTFMNQVYEGGLADKLVDCVISLAKTLDVGIVAEGVETKYQANWLAERQVPLLQGFYLSKPLRSAELIKMIVLEKRNFLKMLRTV